jgi:hypothetical protein
MYDNVFVVIDDCRDLFIKAKINSLYDLHKYMYALQLTCIFPQIFKLCELMLTIPATSAADERSFSALKR